MVKSIILIIVIVLAIVFSGCVNSAEPTQISQPIITKPTQIQPIITPSPVPSEGNKIIKIAPEQLILNKEEIIQVAGTKWEYNKDASGVMIAPNMFEAYNLMFEKKIPEHQPKILWIQLKVYQNKDFIENEFGLQQEKQNNINIGEKGKVFPNGQGDMNILFVRNNIMVMIYYDTSEDFETMFKLGQKQDEKITNILEMIK